MNDHCNTTLAGATPLNQELKTHVGNIGSTITSKSYVNE